jgi:hypothetical protein
MKKEKKEDFPQDTPVAEAEYNPEETLPSKLEHFAIYNKWARKNKLPVKCPTEDFYPKMKVRFQRFDQPTNVLKCRVRNKDIDWAGQLIPGCVYELSMPVIKWLTSLSEPIYAEVKIQNDAGGGRFVEKTETRQVGERARFSCQPVEFSM